YGQHVRVAYLSGAAPFTNRAPLYHAAAAQRAFDRVADQCRADAACRARFPTFREDLAAVLARLKAEPAAVAVTRPDTQAADTVRLTEAGFGDGLRVLLYSAESGRRLPLLLEKARAGDYRPFAQAALSSGYGLQSALRLGLLLSVSCGEDIARIDPAEIPRETAGSFAGDHRVRGQMAACAVWPTADLPADYAAPLTNDVPTLIVSGDLDPVTPPQWGEALLRHFSQGRHLVVPGAHVAENACVDAAGRKLFETGRVDTLDLSCANATPLPPFALEDAPAAP
ncbi:MAG TPA: alpha/beta hydrolase, partial [Phenylobacterium sp.]|nr:alpha/beta hydrolase [Phenylobacterium sp.]